MTYRYGNTLNLSLNKFILWQEQRKLLNVINRLDEDMVEIRFVDLDNNKVEIIDRISKI